MHVSIGTVDAHLRSDHGVDSVPHDEVHARHLHDGCHQLVHADHEHPVEWYNGRITTTRPGR